MPEDLLSSPTIAWRKPSLFERLRLLRGATRRILLHLFRPRAMRASLALRRGACHRCGACCQLIRDCPHLCFDQGLSACKLYGRYRPPNCRNFPIDACDLTNRDLIMPGRPCGFYWD